MHGVVCKEKIIRHQCLDVFQVFRSYKYYKFADLPLVPTEY